MKTKDIVALVIAVVIFMVAGYVAYTQLLSPSGSSSSKQVQVEVVGPITAEFDAAALSQLQDSSKVQDFSVPLELNTGLGNSAVFGQ